MPPNRFGYPGSTQGPTYDVSGRRSKFGTYVKGGTTDPYADILGDANVYRNALEKAVYSGLGPQFQTGLSSISGYLSGAGPLADSGTRAALLARLASGVYGNASNRVGTSYAQYLASALAARRGYQYQKALIKAQQPNFLQTLLGAGGGVAKQYLGGAGAGGQSYDPYAFSGAF